MKDAGGSFVPALGRRDFVKGTLCAVAGVGPALVRGDDAAASAPPPELPAIPADEIAAILAAEILAVSDGALAEKLAAKRRDDAGKVLEKDRGIAERL